MLRKWITVTAEHSGFHRYPDAPDIVFYLRDVHRHLFKVVATIEVTDSNRELEFFQVQEKLRLSLKQILSSVREESCEALAEMLVTDLRKEYGEDRQYTVGVWEDGENGGTVRWEPDQVEEGSE